MKNTPSTESFQLMGLWIFLGALVVRLVYFAWSQSSPFLYQFSTDEAFYLEYARHIVAGQHYPYANFMDPLIAWLLAIPLFFTENTHIVRLLFLLLDSANAYLLYKVTEILTGNRRAAVLAGVIYIFYSLAVIYSVFITKSTPVIFLMLAITFSFLKGIQTQQKRYFALAGLCSALLMFSGASFVMLVVLYTLVLMAISEWRRFTVYYLSAFLLLVISLSAFFAVSGETKSVLPTNGGIVFYISNHAHNPWGTHTPPAFVKQDTPQAIYHAFKQQAQQENPAISTDKAVSGYWYKKAMQENSDDPQQALFRLSNKLKLLISNEEISQNYYFPYIKEQSLKNLPLISFAFILGFGVSGLLAFATADKKMLFILAPAAAIIATCLLFFMSARMRMPLVPFLIIGCAYWILALQSPLKKVVTGLALAGLLVGLSYALTNPRERTDLLQDQYNLAVMMVNANMLNEAGNVMESLLAQENSARFLFLKAVILSKQGRCPEALALYAAVAQSMPNYPDLEDNRQVCEGFIKLH